MLTKDFIADKAQETLMRYSNNMYPVDPILIAGRMGISVFTEKLPRHISGKIFYEDKTILIEETDYFTRQVFSVAHELGHFLLHNDGTSHTSMRDENSSQGIDQKEMEANHFAANLLMPKNEIVRLLGLGFNLDVLASYFNVSSLTMNYRLINLGLKTYD